MPPLKRQAGFTLYELLITVIVASVIAVYGIPGFQNLMANSRSVADTNDLITAFNLARSEATRRRAPIIVCPSTDGAICSVSTDWSTGWIVMTPAAQVLQTWPARSGGAGVLTANVTNVQFSGDRRPDRRHQPATGVATTELHGHGKAQRYDKRRRPNRRCASELHVNTMSATHGVRATYRHSKGLTLVEVLVALVILSIGILGLASLQTVSLTSNAVANQTSQATALAYDMADRMRANLPAARAGAYDIAFQSPAPACGAPATVGTIAQQDISAWAHGAGLQTAVCNRLDRQCRHYGDTHRAVG